MSQFITEKIRNHHVKLKPSGNIYRISEKTENGIVAYYSACPLYRSDGTYIRKQFDGKGIFKGINASVYLGKKQIIV